MVSSGRRFHCLRRHRHARSTCCACLVQLVTISSNGFTVRHTVPDPITHLKHLSPLYHLPLSTIEIALRCAPAWPARLLSLDFSDFSLTLELAGRESPSAYCSLLVDEILHLESLYRGI